MRWVQSLAAQQQDGRLLSVLLKREVFLRDVRARLWAEPPSTRLLLQVLRGEGVTALATAVAVGQSGTLDVDELMKKFKEVYRKGIYKDVGGHSWAE